MDAIPSPSPTDDNGRDPASGRFLVGNRFASGNPHHRQVAELRAALLDAIGPKDVGSIIKKLIALAKAGDPVATKELFDRIYGRSAQSIAADIEVSSQLVLTEEQQKRAAEIARRFDQCTCSFTEP